MRAFTLLAVVVLVIGCAAVATASIAHHSALHWTTRDGAVTVPVVATSKRSNDTFATPSVVSKAPAVDISTHVGGCSAEDSKQNPCHSEGVLLILDRKEAPSELTFSPFVYDDDDGRALDYKPSFDARFYSSFGPLEEHTYDALDYYNDLTYSPFLYDENGHTLEYKPSSNHWSYSYPAPLEERNYNASEYQEIFRAWGFVPLILNWEGIAREIDLWQRKADAQLHEFANYRPWPSERDYNTKQRANVTFTRVCDCYEDFGRTIWRGCDGRDGEITAEEYWSLRYALP